MSVSVRPAIKEDMPKVLELIKELAVYEKEPDAVLISSETLITEGFGEKPLFRCFVATLDSEIVGMAICYFRFSTWTGKTVHLEDLIVSESHRGLGVGMDLYTAIMEYASSEGVKRVEWVVLDWNTPAIQFYEKTGAKLLKDWYLVQFDEEGLSHFLKQRTGS